MTVTPIASETALRNLAWVEGNRRKVDQLSGGKLAYVYMPNTAQAGLVSFNRYFFSQTDKQGVILDERFNSGGQAADYVVDVLRRTLLSYWAPRYGAIYRTPYGGIFGPKVMITNEFAGSGGDLMPWFFREAKLGTLVGKRTWGGLVGVSQYPTLMDGGFVTSPNFAFFTPEGKWDVENKGVTPDVEVELDPRAVREGHDPQLERAVAIAMEQLKKATADCSRKRHRSRTITAHDVDPGAGDRRRPVGRLVRSNCRIYGAGWVVGACSACLRCRFIN